MVSSSSSSSESSVGLDSTTAESTGPLPSCGDGVLDSGEECDPGPAGDAIDCDYDCTAVLCGDGYANLVAGEQCDDGNDALVDDCTPQCRSSLFWDDMESGDPVLTGKWLPPEIPVHQFEGVDFSLASGWQYPSPVNPGTWHSGMYSGTPGTARLVSDTFLIPDPGPGYRHQLVMSHRLRFDANVQDDPGGCEPGTSDGGVVYLHDGVDPPIQIAPPPGQMPFLINDGNCEDALTEPNNPLFDPAMPSRPVYSDISPNNDFITVNVLVPAEAVGRTVRLIFEVGYDCRSCWPAPPLGAGWTLEWVVVAPVPE